MAAKNVILKLLIFPIIMPSSLLAFILIYGFMYDFIFNNPYTLRDIKAIIVLSTISFYTLTILIAGLAIIVFSSLIRYVKKYRLSQAKEIVRREKWTILALASVIS